MILAAFITCSVDASAAKIDLDAGVYSELLWTDNVDISVIRRDSDTYLLVNPYIRFSRDGNRIKANMDYQAKATVYSQHSGMNDLQHMFRGDLGIEIIRDRFFTDVYVAQESEVINANEAISFDGLFYGANTTEKYTAQVSPRGSIPITGDVGIDFSSKHGKIIYDHGIDNIEEHQAYASLGTGGRSAKFNWGVNASKQYTQTGNDYPSEYEQIDVSASYPFFSRIMLNGKIGEKREVLSSYINRSWDRDVVWQGSLIYALSNKTRFEIGGGKDLYSDLAHVSFSHVLPRSVFLANYTQSEVTQLTDDLKNSTEKQVPYKFGRPLNDIYEQKKGTVNWKLTGVKNTVNVNLSGEERFYRNLGETEILLDANLVWQHKISGRSNIVANIDWWRLMDRSARRLDDMTLYSLKYDRKIGTKTKWFTGVKAGIRDGTQAALEYKEFMFLIGAELKY